MLKRTFETLKKYPMIIMLFALPLVYTIANTLLINIGVLYEGTFIDAINARLADGTPIGASVFVKLICNFICFAAWLFLLSPPINYYVYEAADDSVKEGWYMRGLKRCWWRLMVIWAIYLGAVMFASMPLSMGLIFVSMSTGSTTAAVIGMYSIIMLISACGGVFFYSGMAGVVSEKRFGAGLSKMFKVGGKYFWKIFPLTLVSIVPTGVIYYFSFTNPLALTDVFLLVISLVSTVINIIIAVFAMHCYLDNKSNEEEAEAIADNAEAGISEDM